MTQEENEKLMYASNEDIAFYHKCTKGLPTLAGLDGSGNGSDGIPLPYGLGGHSVKCLREIVKIAKPKHIFEIGFNMGWSSSLWLELAERATVFSCDISYKNETIEAAKTLSERYSRRFLYANRLEHNWSYENNTLHDLIFIDGGHLLDDVIADINLALNLKIPYLAFDDFLPEFGQVQDAINKFNVELEQINVNGNIALYKNKTI